MDSDCMKPFLVILIVLFTLNSYSKECEISGRAILWAYDSCFWEYETDDSIHPEVVKCVTKAEKFIDSVSSCEAKRKFKQKICDLAREYDVDGIDPRNCMSCDKALGSAVRNDGI